MNIAFFEEDTSFHLENSSEIETWINSVIDQEGFIGVELNFVFCSDNYLLRLNKDYLGHDTFTDIITFDNSDNTSEIEGDVFISIDRVKENAEALSLDFDRELRRVVIHGVLHLLGYDDKSEEEKMIMRKKEEACLSLP